MVLEKLLKLLPGNRLAPRTAEPSEEKQPALSPEVQLTLKANDGVIAQADLYQLIKDGDISERKIYQHAERPHGAPVALYLLLKRLSTAKNSERDIEQQKRLLDLVVDVVHANTDASESELLSKLRDLAEDVILDTKKWGVENWRVQARNIRGMYGKGLKNWDAIYKSKSEELAANKESVFILGHATFLGLHHFIRAFAKREKPLYIVLPAFLEMNHATLAKVSKSNIPIGYVISPDGFVRYMNIKEHVLSQDRATIVDDISNSGNTIERVREFLNAAFTEQYGTIPPNIVFDFKPILGPAVEDLLHRKESTESN
jgi:hypothetical protein